MKSACLFLTVVCCFLAAIPTASAQDNLIITEFLAQNDRGLTDEDGENQDWVEIYNAGTNSVDLAGWYLTDRRSNLRRWQFPSYVLPANRYLVVFASSKDRNDPAAPLHTNFGLDNGGDYLALVKPDGLTVVSQFPVSYPNPATFPQQVADISYGLAVQQTTIPLITASSPSKFFVPFDGSLTQSWTELTFDDSSWSTSGGGIGFESTTPAEIVLANSATEFSGVQGQDSWFYGFYNKTADVGGVYQASNFVAFPSEQGVWGPQNYWNGVQWDWYSGNPPWTEIGQTNVHPNGSNTGVEHWPIRRWVSEVSGSIKVDWFVAKANASGNGVTGRIFHNNAQRDTAVIGGNRTGGTNRSVIINNVQVGDTIDIALDSVGTDGQANDGSDGSYMSAIVSIVPSYTNQITRNIQSEMLGSNATAYIRIPFTVTNLSALEFLFLRMKYDDGFVAYLNGQYLFTYNGPAQPQWNSTANEARDNLEALQFEDLNITPVIGLLQNGPNVLAIQGLNAAANDSDFLIAAELQGVTLTIDSSTARYFTSPTPGAPNGAGNTNLGPLVFNVEHTPNEPSDNEDIVVTAGTRMTFRPVGNVLLTYRVMFSNEITVPMFDDGVHGDGPPGDGVYGASIPANISTPGQMVRWYVRAFDSSSNVTRFPPWTPPNTNNSPGYRGTVVFNPLLTNPLPVLHFFVPQATLTAAENNDNTRYPASVYYLGEFYDNIGFNQHGQSSAGFPRHSFDIDFNPGYNFRYDPNEDRVDDINLLTTYPDKAKMRNMLSYQVYKDAGSPYHFTYPIRVQHNGVYYADYHLVENGDENFLKRLGLDTRGALYKMYNTFTAADDARIVIDTEAEKKTRKQEGNEDLVALYNGMVANAGASRTNFMWDNLNIPQMINFLAARILTGDVDCCHKNYYFYRDSEGTGEWQGMPWDVDLSFGRNWNGTDTYWDPAMYPNNGLGVGGNNGVFGPLLNTQPFQQMYRRRVRTLMDELLQPTNTPAAQLNFEKQVDYWTGLIKPDADLEKTRWPQWGKPPGGTGTSSSTCCTQTLEQASAELKNVYFPARRVSMYNRAPGEVPTAQPSNAVIRFGAIEYNPTNGNQGQEYIQLINPNNYAVDMSFWSITGAISYSFQGGVVLPANGSLYVSPDVVSFRGRTTGPRRGQGSFVQGNYEGQLSARGESLYLVDLRGRSVNSTNYPGTPSLPQQYLRITEIMYHPPTPSAGSPYVDDDFEYLELKNIGPVAIDLNGVHFTEGVGFAFTNGSFTLDPAETVVLVRNPTAFASRYGSSAIIAGVYSGSLDNNGERIRLDDASNEKILEFRYNDTWYPTTDGMGLSLVIVDENAPFFMWDRKENWRPSGTDPGSPGTSDPVPPTVATVLVNEVLTHTDPPLSDYIELYNPNTNAVNIGGWFISDDFENPKKYTISNGTMIAAGGYYVVYEADLTNAPAPRGFTFSSKGDEAYVFSGDGTNLTGFFHGYAFGAAENAVSFGRYHMSTGAVHFVAQAARTPGATNSLPKVGPVVISEIMYHPPDRAGGEDDGDLEFVELRNISSNAVPLFDGVATWHVRGGIDFDFPLNVTIPAGGHVVVVPFHPLDTARATSFRNKYGLSTSVPLYGPYLGKLDNSNDRVEISRPDTPEAGETPYVLVEEVEYADVLPWAPIADGIGPSLQRVNLAAYGNDAVNWTAVVPTPNAPYPGGSLPTITGQPTNAVGVVGFDASFAVQASGTPPIAYQWFFKSNQLFGATSATLTLSNLTPAHAGDYFAIVFNGAGYVASSNASLTVLTPVRITRAPTNIFLRGATNSETYGYTFTNATFSVDAQSDTPMTFQWRFNGVNIPNATNRTLVVTNVTFANEGLYTCVVTDAVRPVETTAAQLKIGVVPTIHRQPQSYTLLVGETLHLNVVGTGTDPMRYRWRRNGVSVYPTNGGFNELTSITFTNVQTTHSGTYDLIITNTASSAPGLRSSNAVVTVLVDTDGDKTPDVWETDFNFNPNLATDGALDSDGDGMKNFEEFRAGTDPTNAQSYLKIELPSVGPATIQFFAMSNLTYTVQYCDDLNTGSWQNLGDVMNRVTNTVETLIDAAPNPRRYYRLVTPFRDQ